MKFAWAVAGNETIGDQQCIKLRSIQSDWCDSPTVYILDTLWLAPQLNYLPVRRELDMRNYSWIWPFCVYQADDFREIRPGIWLPFHLKKSPYDWAALDEHRDVTRELDEYTVLRADLNPKYEIDLFREIPVPTGITVEERTLGCLTPNLVPRTFVLVTTLAATPILEDPIPLYLTPLARRRCINSRIRQGRSFAPVADVLRVAKLVILRDLGSVNSTRKANLLVSARKRQREKLLANSL